MIRLSRLLLAAMLVGSCAQARAPAVPAATPTGAAVDCLPIQDIRETRVRDDRTIDFVTPGRKVYRNVLPQSCPELGSEGAFAYETAISRLCSVDIITVIRQSGPPRRGASCGLGPFQPVMLTR